VGDGGGSAGKFGLGFRRSSVSQLVESPSFKDKGVPAVEKVKDSSSSRA